MLVSGNYIITKNINSFIIVLNYSYRKDILLFLLCKSQVLDGFTFHLVSLFAASFLEKNVQIKCPVEISI